RVAVRGIEIVDDLFLVPDVVAGRQYVCAQLEQFLGDGGSHAETTGGIFRIHHDEFDLVGFNDMMQVLADDLPSRTAKNVANKEYLQDARSTLDATTRK